MLFASQVLIAASLVLCAVSSLSAGEPTMASVAKVRTLPEGAPGYADVCFSSRIRHPANANDKHDSFRDAAAFHATRFDWVISTDREWIGEVKKRGYTYGGWLSSILTDSPDVKTRRAGRIKNEKGEMLYAPWMKFFEGYWGCVNSPEYRNTFVEHAKRLIDAKADTMQVDDPDMNVASIKWGGCFCEYCKDKAKAEGINLGDEKEMKAFQERSVRAFYKDTRAEIDKYAGRHVPMSSNNYAGKWTFPYDLFEFGMAELPPAESTAAGIYAKQQDAAARGKSQIFTFVNEDAAAMRRLIATTYATGGNPIVPYDVYIRSTATGADRYFGRPAQYSDLFGFVRAMDEALSGHEDAAVAGPRFVDARWGKEPAMVWREPLRPMWAFARTMPGKVDAPVMIHLVDWTMAKPTFTLEPQAASQPSGSSSTQPAVVNVVLKPVAPTTAPAPLPSTLRLRTAAFFGGRRLKMQLLQPMAFDEKAHDAAEAAKDFSTLVDRVEVKVVADGAWTVVELPAVSPWGVLVVEPAR